MNFISQYVFKSLRHFEWFIVQFEFLTLLFDFESCQLYCLILIFFSFNLNFQTSKYLSCSRYLFLCLMSFMPCFISKIFIFKPAYLLVNCFHFEGLGDICLRFGHRFLDLKV